MDDLIAILIAVVFFAVFFLFVKAKERRERDPGISLFGGEAPDPERPSSSSLDRPDSSQ